MSRIFAYCRVSTSDQSPENQIKEIQDAGFKVSEHRVVAETISGSTAAQTRPGFTNLVDKLEQGDILVVTKLDRLGRDTIDVTTTVNNLASHGIKVYCLALGGADLTSSAGQLTMSVISAVAQFERDLLIERTQAGLQRAKAQGKVLGRPKALNNKQEDQVNHLLEQGISVSAIARQVGVSRQTIMRLRDR